MHGAKVIKNPEFNLMYVLRQLTLEVPWSESHFVMRTGNSDHTNLKGIAHSELKSRGGIPGEFEILENRIWHSFHATHKSSDAVSAMEWTL